MIMFKPRTRRNLFALSGAAAIAAALPAGGAPHPDAELLAACADCNRIVAEWLGPYISDHRCTELSVQRADALFTIIPLIPTTPEGVRAKVQVAADAMLWLASRELNTSWREQAELEHQLGIQALHDFLGRAV